MTHEGRLYRGKINYENGILDNEDTKYYVESLKNKKLQIEEKPIKKEEKPKEKPKKESKK